MKFGGIEDSHVRKGRAHFHAVRTLRELVAKENINKMKNTFSHPLSLTHTYMWAPSFIEKIKRKHYLSHLSLSPLPNDGPTATTSQLRREY